MKAAKGNRVGVHYTLRSDDSEGELIEQTSEKKPFYFVIGSGEVLEQFEQAITGKSPGDSFEVSIDFENAYGPELEEALIEFPNDTFINEEGELDDDLFEIGEIIPLLDENGNEVHGVVTEIKLNTIVLDFNHPLAGEDLHFIGKIVSVEA